MHTIENSHQQTCTLRIIFLNRHIFLSCCSSHAIQLPLNGNVNLYFIFYYDFWASSFHSLLYSMIHRNFWNIFLFAFFLRPQNITWSCSKPVGEDFFLFFFFWVAGYCSLPILTLSTIQNFFPSCLHPHCC